MEADQNGIPRSGFGAKAAFIRGQPESMSAREVVDAAAAQGLRISMNHVYNMRATKAKSQLSSNTQPGAQARVKRRNRQALLGATERRLRTAIAEVGLERTQQIFEELTNVFLEE